MSFRTEREAMRIADHEKANELKCVGLHGGSGSNIANDSEQQEFGNFYGKLFFLGKKIRYAEASSLVILFFYYYFLAISAKQHSGEWAPSDNRMILIVVLWLVPIAVIFLGAWYTWVNAGIIIMTAKSHAISQVETARRLQYMQSSMMNDDDFQFVVTICKSSKNWGDLPRFLIILRLGLVLCYWQFWAMMA